MLLGLQAGSIATGFAAAVLWFRSAAAKAPPGTWEGIGRLEGFLDQVSRLNMWAAGFTGASLLLSAGSTLVSALAGK